MLGKLAPLLGQARAKHGRKSKDTGNATAEFVMVTSLAIVLCAVVLQVTFALYAKNILVDAASSGARYGALLDRSPRDGGERTRDIIKRSLPDAYLTSVSVREIPAGGVTVVEVQVEGTLPVLGILGFDRGISVVGHATQQG